MINFLVRLTNINIFERPAFSRINSGMLYVESTSKSTIVFSFCLAIAGSALTFGLTPESKNEMFGVVTKAESLTVGQGLMIELVLTMILLLTVLGSVSKDHGRGYFGYANSLAIGESVVVAHLIGVSNYEIFRWNLTLKKPENLSPLQDNGINITRLRNFSNSRTETIVYIKLRNFNTIIF